MAGQYPLHAEKQQHIEESISFVPEPTKLYLLKKEEMDWRKLHETDMICSTVGVCTVRKGIFWNQFLPPRGWKSFSTVDMTSMINSLCV